MLRSIQLVNSWSRDGNHEFTTCEWNAIVNDEVENLSCTNPTRVHRSWSRVHEFTKKLFHCSWTRNLKFTSWMKRSIGSWLGIGYPTSKVLNAIPLTLWSIYASSIYEDDILSRDMVKTRYADRVRSTVRWEFQTRPQLWRLEVCVQVFSSFSLIFSSDLVR